MIGSTILDRENEITLKRKNGYIILWKSGESSKC